MQNHPSVVVPNLNHDEGLGRKKTMFVMVTVVGCIAILCPMLFGSSSLPPNHLAKDYHSGSGAGSGVGGGGGSGSGAGGIGSALGGGGTGKYIIKTICRNNTPYVYEIVKGNAVK